MSIESQKARMSVVSVARPWQPQRKYPDGDIDDTSRQTIGWLYAGFDIHKEPDDLDRDQRRTRTFFLFSGA